jgi:hypothetical protein
MGKLLALTLSLATVGFAASPADAKTAGAANSAAAAAPQGNVMTVQGGRYNRRVNRRARTVTQSRLVRNGRRVFRETYRITYLPNGGTRTRLISRVRVR